MTADEEGPEEKPPVEEGRPPRHPRGGVDSLIEGPLELARALLLGLKDTAKDVADGARAEAQAAYEERWSRFEDLTKHRRKRRE